MFSIKTITPKTFRTALIVVVVLLLSILTAYQGRFFLQGPSIVIDQINLESDLSYIDIAFMAHNTNRVSVSNKVVVPQISGLVEMRLYLQKGKNTFLIEAQDAYGATEKEYLYITYPQ